VRDVADAGRTLVAEGNIARSLSLLKADESRFVFAKNPGAPDKK
jgi:hypothetical protein